ncbi:MAG: lipoprotein transmembrane [Burkholderiales bacterium RIFCSPLOWO2_02_FULL_57_36]|nr:MAG: lipoprotein transmembrane [Burkholderiales bacterium RIFCSPLOWO2_02_FULL_57_36]
MTFGIRIICAFVIACAASLMPAFAFAAELSGVKVEDAVKVGDQEIRLNGVGVRYKAIFKVYVAGLYLNTKKTSVPDVLAAPGSKRITLVMLREVSNEEFGQSFMAGIQKNSERAERAKLITPLMKFGEMFASIPVLKKGDVITIDWIPNSGTHIHLNNKKIIDVIPEPAFYNVILKIWLGEKPADTKLKGLLLGDAEDAPRSTNSY